jgi:hypothetical protein
MDTEVALYWKVMRRHLQAEAQVSISPFQFAMQHIY